MTGVQTCALPISGAGLAGPRASRVRHLLRVAVGNPAAGRARHLAVLDFADPTGAAHLAGVGLRNPDLLAAHAGRALDLFGPAAAGLIDAAAAVFVEAERAGVSDTAIDDRTGDAFLDDLPLAAADVLAPGFGDRTTDGVTDILVGGLRVSAVTGTADVAIAGLVVWLADRVADVAIAGLVAGLADRVADIAVAGLVARLANLAADRAVAGLVARLADGVTDVAVTGLVTRLADRVALIPIAGLVNRALALDRHLFDAGVHHRLTLLVLLGTPHGLLHGLVATTVTGPRLAVVLTRLAAFGRTASVTTDPAEESGF